MNIGIARLPAIASYPKVTLRKWSPQRTPLALHSLKLDDPINEELLERARQLDMQALAQVHNHFYGEVYRYVRYRVEDEPACEDIASEVFVRLIDALNRRGGPRKNLHGWLMGTASNLVNDYFRKRYHHPVNQLENEQIEQIPSESQVDENIEVQQLRARVQNALRKLTPEQQHVLALRFAEDRSLEETAQLVGKNVNAIKALQFRALASLRRLLSEDEK